MEHAACMGEVRSTYGKLVVNPEGKTHVRGESNIKMNL
jgi:hypothetical protein